MIRLTNNILVFIGVVILGAMVALGLAVSLFFTAGMLEYQYIKPFPIWSPELWSTTRLQFAVVTYAVCYVAVWFLFVIPTLEE